MRHKSPIQRNKGGGGSSVLEELSLARADGRYLKLLGQLSKLDVLVLDDWGLIQLSQPQQEDLFQLLDDRIQKRSTIATSQLPVEHGHQNMANPTIADALLDRLVQPAYRIELKGESLRKRLTKPLKYVKEASTSG
ncbi:MAG: hypothetical protein F4Z16_08440 [Rhodothermaceae bacterium]|nr:hypothetical protein [Rhodothermaceae bacterium]MYD68455.1 hypothetical protein [Rhodothermaceae bacterium]MYJ06931.1 hypothetical protein [Rhodothermaceae bacterium]